MGQAHNPVPQPTVQLCNSCAGSIRDEEAETGVPGPFKSEGHTAKFRIVEDDDDETVVLVVRLGHTITVFCSSSTFFACSSWNVLCLFRAIKRAPVLQSAVQASRLFRQLLCRLATSGSSLFSELPQPSSSKLA